MQSDLTRCSECGGEMEVGFLVDVTDSRTLQQRWARGPVVKSWILGVKVKQSLLIETHRCKNCGLLKSYAK
jgi:hypothetical protein